jgi:predicted nicotinamide N-methyase
MPRLERLPEDHIYQAYGLYLLEPKHRLMRRLKRVYAPSVHGHKAWGSSFLIMDYLIHNPIRRGSRVMEIGCGWGPAGIFCAKHFGAKVTGVDIDKEVFPFLDVLAELNDVQVEKVVNRFEDLKASRLGREQVIIGSDICFWDSMVKPLYNLISRALRSGTRRVVIADPGRPTFYELSELCARKFDASLAEWYATEPERFAGEVLEVKSR